MQCASACAGSSSTPRRSLAAPRRDASQLPVQNPEVIPSRGVRLVHRGRLPVQRDRPDRVPAQLRLGPQIRQRRRQRAPRSASAGARASASSKRGRVLRRARTLVQPPKRFQRADVRRVVAKALGNAANAPRRSPSACKHAPREHRHANASGDETEPRSPIAAESFEASVDDRGVVVPARAVDEQQRPDAVEHGERVGGAARRGSVSATRNSRAASPTEGGLNAPESRRDAGGEASLSAAARRRGSPAERWCRVGRRRASRGPRAKGGPRAGFSGDDAMPRGRGLRPRGRGLRLRLRLDPGEHTRVRATDRPPRPRRGSVRRASGGG